MSDLPKALSQAERNDLSIYAVGVRAVALIDSLSEHLAQAVARMMVAERSVDDVTKAVIAAEASEYATLDRLARAKARVNQLEKEIAGDERWFCLVAERDAAEAKVRELEGKLKLGAAIYLEAEQKLEKANALLQKGKQFVGQTNGVREKWCADVDACLSGQTVQPIYYDTYDTGGRLVPVAPSRQREPAVSFPIPEMGDGEWEDFQAELTRRGLK